MPIRTTDDAILKVNTDLDEDADFDPHIEIASALVDEWCATKVDGNGAPLYTATRLEQIERYLACHFATLDDPKATSDWIGAVRSTYETDKVGLGLDLTRYGQHAKILDAAGGGLAAADAAAKNGGGNISITWLGDYDDEAEGENG